MRKQLVGAAVLLAAFAAAPAEAQKPLSLELGGFGQYTMFDSKLDVNNAATVGGRAALWLWKRFALEADIQYGKTDWTAAGVSGNETKSLTIRPYAGRLLWAIPAGEKSSILIGAGYQNNVFIGREVDYGSGTVARNEYEDSFTGLLGLRHCLNDRWNFRGDVVSNHAPSPNFNSTPGTLDGRANTYGVRLGVGVMARGGCYNKAPAPLPPPPPPPPPPPAAPAAPAAPVDEPPTLMINAPANGSDFNGPVTFTATCTDKEDGTVSNKVTWRSNRDGDLGTGASVTKTLSAGTHTVTATCVDSNGHQVTQQVTITVNELLVRLNWVYFNFDQSTLTRAGRDTLNRVISTLKEKTDWKVAVEGHTDPYGSDTYNLSLSERRATTVTAYLTRNGIDASRISQKGFGEQCLVLDDDHDHPTKSRQAHSVNRRVEIWSVGDKGVSANCRR
ncbi:MAG: OmpA family protein [Gemmatimonadota bacterium]